MLDVWPPLSIVINQSDKLWQPTWGTNDAIPTLEHNDRIPVLAGLWLESDDETVPVDPDLFLGGYAPCLRFLQLVPIPFPGLSKPLSPATHNIPHSARRWSRASPR
jgi:hypothetical protein